jgi:DNA polymerase-3 subunit delta'
MTILAPVHNPVVIGHDDAMRQVAAAFASGRMHHAWLISGIEGIGKTTLAYHIANHVLSSGQNPLGRPDLQHRVTKLIMAESHPDMLVVRRARDDKTGELRNVIVVDDALKIAAFLHKTSTHGGWRVVIIDEAHILNRHGQSAILKILEEPPARVLIVMTATTAGALLPTIRSRCRELRLAPLDPTQMRIILARAQPDLSNDDLTRLIDLSGGSVGFALKIIRNESLPLYQELLVLLDSLPNLDMARLHKLADQISRKADAEAFDVIRTLLMENLRLAARNSVGSGVSLDHKVQLWERIRTSFALADTSNLDRKLAFINAINEIKSDRYPA